MRVSQAIQYWTGYHKLHSKRNTLRAYHPTSSKFGQHFEDRDRQSLSPGEILSFLTKLTEGNKQRTKHTRYSYLSSFFNFIKNNNEPSVQNPCDSQALIRDKTPNFGSLEKGQKFCLTTYLLVNKIILG